MKVYAVTVFENGDMTTSVWGVFDSEEKAEVYKAEVLKDTGKYGDGYYLEVEVTEHEVS